MPAGRHINTSLCAILVFTGCSAGPGLDIKIDESSQGAVYLKRISDRSFQAAHPIKIDSSIVALVLSGILIREDQGLENPMRPSDARRALSGSEVGYLAPIISEGLRRAAPDQEVEFRVGQTREAAPFQRGRASDPSLSAHARESTTGVLYAYGRSLYITLTQYHLREESTTIINMANRGYPDGTGLANRTVSFIPEAARRPDSFLDARSTDKTLVIDYELLAMLPPASMPSASAQPAPPPAPPQATNGGTVEPVQRDAEIEALRKELQEIKKQLAEQQAERARSQPKNAVPQP